jgi:hypothetical protein
VSFTASGDHVDFAAGVSTKAPPNPCAGKFRNNDGSAQ